MDDLPNAPIRVQPTSLVPMIMNFFRQVAIAVGFIGLLVALGWKRDLNGFIAALQGDQALLAATAVAGIAGSLSSLWRTWRNESQKRQLAQLVDDHFAQIKAHGPLKYLAIVAAGLFVTSCATMAAVTPAQRLYEARAAYVVAQTAAVAYAESPTASPAIVAAIVHARAAAKPAIGYADAYVDCHALNRPVTVIDGRELPCSSFDFSTARMSQAAVALRAAVAQLVAR